MRKYEGLKKYLYLFKYPFYFGFEQYGVECLNIIFETMSISFKFLMLLHFVHANPYHRDPYDHKMLSYTNYILYAYYYDTMIHVTNNYAWLCSCTIILPTQKCSSTNILKLKGHCRRPHDG